MPIDLLPPNRSAFESRVAASHPLDHPVELRTLWNPATCPVEFLPFLAWAFSVDQWHEHWPERIKRRVIANSAQLHRIKGTRPAVELAMESLGVTVEMKEWFETSPPLPRGTFSALLWVNDNLTPDAPALLSNTLYRQLRQAINSAKNVRSHYTFKVGVRFGPSSMGASSTFKGSALRHESANAITPPLKASAGITVNSAQRSAATTRRSAQLEQAPLKAKSRAAVTAVQQALAIARHAANFNAQARLLPTPLGVACTCQATALARYSMETST